MTITRAGLAFGSALVILGVVVAAPAFVLVGLLGLLALGVSGLWSRFGLRDLHYERSIGRERTLWGDDVPLDLAVWNDKPLPLPWLSVDDFATGSTVVREESLIHTDLPGLAILRSRWTVGSYERVVRHLTIAADRRGSYALGPVRVTVADPFGYGLAIEEHEDRATLIVRPRTLPVRLLGQQHAQAGDLRTRHSLFEDPALFAGVRPYRPGDPMRRVHWRATARTGTPVSKRFDPSRLESLLVALDVQTMSGTIWESDDEMVESLMVAASSLVRHSLIEGASCGLAAMALSRTPGGFALVAPRTGRSQLGSVADMLGRLDIAPSAPFDHLLVRLPQKVQAGTTIVVLTARDPAPYMAALRRLDRSGYPVQVVGLGPNGQLAASRARALGFPAMVGSLNPDWRTSDALVLAS